MFDPVLEQQTPFQFELQFGFGPGLQMASNAVFFLVKSHISSISTLGKVPFSKVLITDLPLLLPIYFIQGEKKKKRKKTQHPNVSHN